MKFCISCNMERSIDTCTNCGRPTYETDQKFTIALLENRCGICGTPGSSQIKVLDKIYITVLTMVDLIPICNLCLPHIPPQKERESMNIDHIIWKILEKRLQQYTVYNKICKNDACKTLIVSVRKEKEFCSDNCRSKYWQKQRKEKTLEHNIS